MATSYTPLEPALEGALGKDYPTYTSGSNPSLFTSTSFLYTLFFVVIVVAASGKFAQAGLLRMEASESGIRKSNELFKKTTLGLLGVFSLWLILATVNKDLLTGNVGLDALHADLVNNGSGVFGGNGGTSGGGGASGSYPADGVAKLGVLNAAKITINHNNVPCTDAELKQTKPQCTSVDGLRQETIDMLKSLKSTCPSCNIVITGGTEPGHASHGPNLKPVDLQIESSNDALYSFIKSKGVGVKNDAPAPCNIKYTWGGFTFWDENVGCSTGNTGRHWHVS